MRLQRAKQYRKHLRFFKIVFGITEPYQMLLDGNFVHICLSKKFNVADRLTKLLQGSRIAICTTRCIIAELESLGETCRPALEFVTKFCKMVHCGHMTCLSAANCISILVGESNDKKYMVASQDADLRAHMRSVPGVPIVYANPTILILEPPSKMSMSDSRKVRHFMLFFIGAGGGD